MKFTETMEVTKEEKEMVLKAREEAIKERHLKENRLKAAKMIMEGIRLFEENGGDIVLWNEYIGEFSNMVSCWSETENEIRFA